MTDTHGLNLTTHRAAESVWERRGWDGTREQLAVTRWLVGIGGGVLALQGLRQRSIAGSLLAGIGSGLAWWALTGEGDLSEARRWVGHTLERVGLTSGGSGARRVGGVVPGERRAVLDADGRHRSEWSGPRLMLNPLKVPISWTELAKRTYREVLADDCLGLAAQLAYYFFLALFPALLFLVAIVSFIPIAGLLDAITREPRAAWRRARCCRSSRIRS